MRFILQFIAWLLILLGGLFLLVYISVMMRSSTAGGGYGTGVLSYRFVASFNSFSKPEIDDLFVYTITIVAEEPPRFMLWGNVSPKYGKGTLSWHIFTAADEHLEGEAQMDLQGMKIRKTETSMALNPDSLSTLLGLNPANAPEAMVAESLFEFLQSARDGTIPRPSHHGIQLPGPLPGRMQHSARGYAFKPLELAWIVAWSAFGIGLSIRGRNKRHA